MKIGVMSDSHGRDERLARAAAALVERGADALVHCGDLGGPAALAVLGRAGRPAYAVSGNVDRDVAGLEMAAEREGVSFHSEVIEVPLGDDRYLVATHGNDEELLHELALVHQFPYLCHGHTHRRRDERVGPVRVINPGCLHQPRGGEHYTVALLDTDTDTLEFIPIER